MNTAKLQGTLRDLTAAEIQDIFTAKGVSTFGLPPKKKFRKFSTKPYYYRFKMDRVSEEFPDLAVCMGKYQVIDFDLNAADNLKRLFEKNPDLQETYIVKTSKGYHVYVEDPSLQGAHLSFNGEKVGDLKCRGGHVVGEGSLHEKGIKYTRYRGSPDSIIKAKVDLTDFDNFFNRATEISVAVNNNSPPPEKPTEKVCFS